MQTRLCMLVAFGLLVAVVVVAGDETTRTSLERVSKQLVRLKALQKELEEINAMLSKEDEDSLKLNRSLTALKGAIGKRGRWDPFDNIERVWGNRWDGKCGGTKPDDCEPLHDCPSSYGVDWDSENFIGAGFVRNISAIAAIPAGIIASPDIETVHRIAQYISTQAPLSHRYAIYWFNPNFSFMDLVKCGNSNEKIRLDGYWCELLRNRDPRLVHIFSAQQSLDDWRLKRDNVFDDSGSRSAAEMITSVPLGLGGCDGYTNGRVHWHDLLQIARENIANFGRENLFHVSVMTQGRQNRKDYIDIMNKTWHGTLVNDYPKGLFDGHNPSYTKQSYKKWITSKFIFSPPGVGEDCYRHYEAIMMGTIPVVHATAINKKNLEGLPVLFVDPRKDPLFAGVTKEYLEQQYVEIMSKKYDLAAYEKLRRLHWRNQFDHWKKVLVAQHESYLKSNNNIIIE